MSGLDEERPVCPKCDISLKDGLDNRRLIARNSDGMNLITITSVRQENLTGVRIIHMDRELEAESVIACIYCSNCLGRIYDEDFIFKIKKYIYTYDAQFGMGSDAYNRLEYLKEGGVEFVPRRVQSYDSYVSSGAVCNNCGFPEDECHCDDDEYCSECGNLFSDCTC